MNFLFLFCDCVIVIIIIFKLMQCIVDFFFYWRDAKKINTL